MKNINEENLSVLWEQIKTLFRGGVVTKQFSMSTSGGTLVFEFPPNSSKVKNYLKQNVFEIMVTSSWGQIKVWRVVAYNLSGWRVNKEELLNSSMNDVTINHTNIDSTHVALAIGGLNAMEHVTVTVNDLSGTIVAIATE